MNEMLTDLESQVQDLAAERTADILPLLYDRLMSREGLERCPRHSMLSQRVKAEIRLHHIKKAVRNDGFFTAVETKGLRGAAHLELCLKQTEKVRQEYRAKPCTCWLEHR